MNVVLPYIVETVQKVRSLGNVRVNSMTDDQIRRLYSIWSEMTYCAGWMDPRPDVVADFVEWATTAPCDWNDLRPREGVSS